MKKLAKKEMEKVRGGQRNEYECGKVQALADAYARDGASEADWDKWARDYASFC
ncbi:MAG: hypothetical protein LKG14_03595 [Prevotella sp.]|nr:hypothetical protein [Prevotella sp.]